MATITFKDGSQKQVNPVSAVRLWFIQQGKMAGSPKVTKYLKNVQAITFDTSGRQKQIEQGRLPYVD